MQQLSNKEAERKTKMTLDTMFAGIACAFGALGLVALIVGQYWLALGALFVTLGSAWIAYDAGRQ